VGITAGLRGEVPGVIVIIIIIIIIIIIAWGYTSTLLDVFVARTGTTLPF
jgi:hypothetical protein